MPCRPLFILPIILAILLLNSCEKVNSPQKERWPSLRGMNVTWNERMKTQGSHAQAGSPGQAWFTLADVERMKKAGATCLELHQIGLPSAMPQRNIPDESFFTNWVDTWVDWCARNQMYCIINITGLGAWADWAWNLSTPPWLWQDFRSSLSYTDKAACDSLIRDFFDLDVARQDTNRAAFIALWKYIANRYKGNQYVMYSIMNEPFWNVDIPDEAAAVHLGQSYSTFMKQIVDGIRSTGSTQYILIDLPFLWNSNWRFTVQPVDRDNIIWEAHVYGSVWEPDLHSFRSDLQALARLFVDDFNKPLFIGEYGINPITSIHDNPSADWKSIISAEVSCLDSLPIIGRQFTSWDNMNGEYAGFDGESNLTSEESEWIIEAVLTGP
jgi:hypothetical protein